jgi:hypothetical protein
VLKVADSGAESVLHPAALANEDGPARDIVLLNAGAALYAANVAATMVDGVRRAREAVASGQALARLHQFVDRSKRWPRMSNILARSSPSNGRKWRPTSCAHRRVKGEVGAAGRPGQLRADAEARERRATSPRRCAPRSRPAAGGDRRDQEGQPQQGRAARTLRAGRDRRQLPGAAARPA